MGKLPKNQQSSSKERRGTIDRSKKLRDLKEAADSGYTSAMYDYAMEVYDLKEKKRYLKMAADCLDRMGLKSCLNR